MGSVFNTRSRSRKSQGAEARATSTGHGCHVIGQARRPRTAAAGVAEAPTMRAASSEGQLGAESVEDMQDTFFAPNCRVCPRPDARKSLLQLQNGQQGLGQHQHQLGEHGHLLLGHISSFGQTTPLPLFRSLICIVDIRI